MLRQAQALNKRAGGSATTTAKLQAQPQRRARVTAAAAAGNGVVNKPAAAGSSSSSTSGAPAAAAARGPFTNTNRFKVSAKAAPAFEAAWRAREAAMRSFPGFQGFSLERGGGGSSSDGSEYVASQTWATIPEWEAWNLSEPCRRSHLPLGIWQRVPRKGEGFPEDFVPFVDYDEPVNAKYP